MSREGEEEDEEEMLKFRLVQRLDSVEASLQPPSQTNNTSPPQDTLKMHTRPNFQVAILLCHLI